MAAVCLPWLAAAVALEFASMTSFALLQRRMLAAAGTRVALRRMSAITLAANAVNATLPGGSALSFAYTVRRLRASGASAPAAGFTLIASGLLSTTTFMLLGLVAAIGTGPSTPMLLGLAGLVLVGTVLSAARQRAITFGTGVARRALTLLARLRRRPAEAALASLDHVADGLRAIRTRPVDWLAGAAFAAANWLADLGCLAVCCHAAGVHGVALSAVGCGYLAGMSAASCSLLPGGIGATDVAIIIALTHGGASSATATAAVLCFRIVSFGLTVGAGWLVHLTAWCVRPGNRLGIPRIRAGARVPSVVPDPNESTRGARHGSHPDRRAA